MSVRGTLVVPRGKSQKTSKRTMQIAFEFLTSAVFFLFTLVQLGLVALIVLARVLKATGVLHEERDQPGLRRFLKGFC